MVQKPGSLRRVKKLWPGAPHGSLKTAENSSCGWDRGRVGDGRGGGGVTTLRLFSRRPRLASLGVCWPLSLASGHPSVTFSLGLSLLLILLGVCMMCDQCSDISPSVLRVWSWLWRVPVSVHTPLWLHSTFRDGPRPPGQHSLCFSPAAQHWPGPACCAASARPGPPLSWSPGPDCPGGWAGSSLGPHTSLARRDPGPSVTDTQTGKMGADTGGDQWFWSVWDG